MPVTPQPNTLFFLGKQIVIWFTIGVKIEIMENQYALLDGNLNPSCLVSITRTGLDNKMFNKQNFISIVTTDILNETITCHSRWQLQVAMQINVSNDKYGLPWNNIIASSDGPCQNDVNELGVSDNQTYWLGS